MPDSTNDGTLAPRRRRIRWHLVWPLAVLLTFAVFIVVGSRLADRSLGLQAVKLADGTVISLESVTFGTTHQFDPNPFIAAGFLPWKRYSPVSQSSPPNSTGVWLTRRGKEDDKPLGFEFWSRAVVVDDQGFEVEAREWGEGLDGFGKQRSWGGTGIGRVLESDRLEVDVIVAHVIFPPFRHRGETFKLRVYDKRESVAAEFDIPKFDERSIPEWTPETLPATRTDGDLSVTLESLEGKVDVDEINFMAVAVVDIDPAFTIRERGQVSKQWETNNTYFSDAAGNRQRNWHITLSPNESAWLLEEEFFRNESATFLPTELWTIAGIPLPEKESEPLRALSSVVDGVSISLDRIAAPGELKHFLSPDPKGGPHSSGRSGYGAPLSSTSRYHVSHEWDGTNGTFTIESAVPYLVTRVVGLSREQQRMFLRISDDQGRRPKKIENVEFEGNTYWFFDLPSGAKSVTATFVVHRGRTFQFYVKPPMTMDELLAAQEQAASKNAANLIEKTPSNRRNDRQNLLRKMREATRKSQMPVEKP